MIVPPDASAPLSAVDSNAAMIQTVVPAVVLSVAGAVAGVVVLVVLLKRREKKKAKAQTVRMSLQRSNSRRMTRNQSKYGIERNTINSSPDRIWEPPADYEFEEVDKMPFDMSKKIDFNVGSNQFKVGQQYTDVITITAKDKVRHSKPCTTLANLALQIEISHSSRSSIRVPSAHNKEAQNGLQPVDRHREERQTS